MTGPEMLVKTVVRSLGIQINPEEISQAIETARATIPQLAGTLQSFMLQTSERLQHIESQQIALLKSMETLLEKAGV